jgi:hypothetical protein
VNLMKIDGERIQCSEAVVDRALDALRGPPERCLFGRDGDVTGLDARVHQTVAQRAPGTRSMPHASMSLRRTARSHGSRLFFCAPEPSTPRWSVR